jgi:Ca-activated chloride channel family protein
MHSRFFFRWTFIVAVSAAVSLFLTGLPDRAAVHAAPDKTGKITQGSLMALAADGKAKGVCPLKHTTVKAEISGFLSRVSVTQEFHNPFKDKIEAVYTFPLPPNAAVDDMTMVVGERTVKGKIMRREQAQAVYEAAKQNGQVASLLDQERANIFTQSVANIMPGERVTVTLSYVERLKYEEGSYEFVFPMVVGPRYVPGGATGQQGGGFSPDTTSVPDGSRITPQVAARGTRAGHDISIEVALDAGVPVDELKSNSHEVDIEKRDAGRAVVKLKDKETIPNKDFILKYDVAGRKIEDAVLAHRSERGGFFTLILQPPDRVTAEDVTPKEIVFVLDTSGSMSGFPIDKAKEAMKLALEGMYPQDTFNLITFAGDTNILFDKPVPATKENLEKAQKFLETREGGGGTEMMKAIRAALDPSDAADHIRIVCFMTDGYVGDDMSIIAEVQKHPNARVFSFGIGSSVNRFLLDKMAEYGRGEVEYVALTDDGSAAARRFHERVRSPLLTDITVEWAGLQVMDVYPQRIPDLFSAKPVILSGRYTNGGRGVIRLKGKMSGRDFVREIPVELPQAQPQHDVLATLWARTRIDDLMGQDYEGAQHGSMRPELQETITQLGLEYRLMTQFTSFVAVEEMTITDGGVPRRVDVPVEMPEGVSRDGVFGDKDEKSVGPVAKMARKSAVFASPRSDKERSKRETGGYRSGRGGKGSGRGNNVGGGDRHIGGGGAGGGGGAIINRPATVSESVKPSPTTNSRPSGVLGASIITDDEARVQVLSPEDRRRQEMLGKLHPSIIAIIERLTKRNSQPGPDELKFVRAGKAEVQIWLTDKTPEALLQLKQLGFEVVLDPKTGKVIIGRMPIEKLAKLSELKFVRYIAPQLSGS